MSRPKEAPPPPPEARADAARRQAIEEGERRRLEYVATLHPRERENLDPR